MDNNKSMNNKFYFFDVLRKEYDFKFGKRKWDGMALNYYYFKEKPFTVVFSWNWRSSKIMSNGESLVAEIQIENHNGGDKLYKHLQFQYLNVVENFVANTFEWFVMPGMSRIICEIDEYIRTDYLSSDKDHSDLIHEATDAMHLLEEKFGHLINRYFEEYIK